MTDGMTVAEVLDRAADLIEPEGAWTQGALARGKSGRPVETRRHAVRFCVLGAINVVAGWSKAWGATPIQAEEALLQAIGGRRDSIAVWNDAPGRTHAEVVAKLREAAAIARATRPATGEGK